MERYYLSVDGGGTKTELLLARDDSSIVYKERCGPTSVKSVGEAAARENLAEGLSAFWRQVGFGLEKVAHSVFGLSGCDTPGDAAVLAQIVESLGFSEGTYTLCNDGVLAFYAGAEPPGMVLIAGTGSIVVGVDSRGGVTRTGGWGYGFSDLGSGYWLGSQALREALRFCDGCRSWVPWFPAIAKALGADSLDHLPQAAADITRSDTVAALASVLLDWPEPEPLRQEILAAGSKYLAELLVANGEKMAIEPEKPLRIVLAGGCMRSKAYARLVASRLPERLREAVVAGDRNISPVEGGIRMARLAIGRGGAPAGTAN